MKSIAITGPECSGKTTLSRQLAGLPGAALVPEFARHYLAHLGRPYTQDDLLHIAQNQQRLIHTACASGSQLVIADTELSVIKIWSMVKYRSCHPQIEEGLSNQRFDLYLLCRPDLPWTYDPLRENPHDRHRLFELYELEMKLLGCRYEIIEGTQRLAAARHYISSL